jgi:hypothetical protein
MEPWAVTELGQPRQALRDVVHHSINTEWARAYGKDAPVYGTVGADAMIAGSAGVGAMPRPWYLSLPASGAKTSTAESGRRHCTALAPRLLQCRLRIS